jgi:hypothetical protein
MLLFWAGQSQPLIPAVVSVGAGEFGAVYQLDTLVQLQATFMGAGAPADPASATIIVKTPDGEINEYAPTRLGVGVYEYRITTSQSGPWIYKWRGTLPVEVTSPDVYCLVQGSAVLSG